MLDVSFLKSCLNLDLATMVDHFLLCMIQHAAKHLPLASVPGIANQTDDGQHYKEEDQTAKDDDGDKQCCSQAV